MGNLQNWTDATVEEANKLVIDNGDQDNIMFAPNIVKKLRHLLLIFPLWSNALSNKMNSPYNTAVGSFVESEINQLKNNLLKKNSRVDEFLMDYLQSKTYGLLCKKYEKVTAWNLLQDRGN
uniref:Uncharacterized protein n=1 Tax=Graphocephala atropunctata TaxID=36148 RepID=A0A1B6MGW2_9HEMI